MLMFVQIPITGVTNADDLIDFLLSYPVAEALRTVYRFEGSDGGVAASNIELTIDAKGDGNSAGAGHIRLQADGRSVRVGDAMDAKSTLILDYLAVGECVRT